MKGILLFSLCLLGTALSKQLIKPRGVEIKPRESEEYEYASLEYDFSSEEYDSSEYDSEEYYDESEEYYEESEESARDGPINVGTLSQGGNMRKASARQYAPLECGSQDILHYGEYAVIETPNYGKKGRKGRYPNNFECKWDIEIPASSELLMWCEFFQVRRGDYLYIFDQGYYGYAKDGFSFPTMTSPDETATLSLSFKSNRRRNGKGFRCFIESEPQGFSNSTTTTTQAPVTTTVDNGGNTEQCTCGIPNRSNRIVGGQETEVNEYPWQVGLVSSSGTRPWCGGTLISDRHVMTAAHCTAGSSASSIKVLLGEHYTNDGQYNRVALSAITDHPGYNSNNMDNDFSILTLAEPVTLSGSIRPACLPWDTSKTYAGEKVTVTGWGTLTSGGNQPTSLQEVDVTVTTNAVCNQAYGIISDNMICAADSGKDSCQGDSGGPLVAFEEGRYALVGVVSFGYGCAFDGYPGVYARVTAQKDWILANTQGTQDSNCAMAGR